MRILSFFLVLFLALGCGGGLDPSVESVATQHRRMTLWVDYAISENLARTLGEAGVSSLVVRRGRVDLSSGTPVLHLTPPPEMGGDIPIASALRVETGRRAVDPEMAGVLWNALEPSLGHAQTEIILDLPETLEGMDRLTSRLRAESGLAVVPVLTLEQMATPAGLAVAQAAGVCVVPLFGSAEAGLRGLSGAAQDSLSRRVQGLVAKGVKLRPAIVIRPRTEPRLSEWGEDLNPLCEDDATDVRTSTALHRSFVFRHPMTWGGRSWSEGDRLEMTWMDASRLDAAFREIDRLVMPEVTGWDLFTFPEQPQALGMGTEALLEYLNGRGPAPTMETEVTRQGRSLRVEFVNRSPFSTAVTAHGNWLEVAVGAGNLVVRGRGDFDRVSVGGWVDGKWRDGLQGGGNTVRFGETYVGPGERSVTGSVVLPSWRSPYTIRWRLVLSDGTVVTGADE